MILPGKYILPDRALISVGADILGAIGPDNGSTVSDIWAQLKIERAARADSSPLPFDWFVLALTMLFAISAIDLDGDDIRVRARA